MLDGGDGNDKLVAGSGNDQLLGGAGNDELQGSSGNDLLVGGSGNDKLTGSSGSDTFAYHAIADGIDTITDFKTTGSSQDKIAFDDSMFTGFTGDDGFDLIGDGFLRAQAASGGRTFVQIDADGGGNNFQTIAILEDQVSNGVLADHTMLI